MACDRHDNSKATAPRACNTPKRGLTKPRTAGEKYIPGFFHIDILDYPHIDKKALVTDLSFFESGQVELIYAAHLLEHFGRDEFLKVLAEWFRVLAPGGVLRLAVPDFGTIAKLYVSGEIEGGLHTFMGLVVGGSGMSMTFTKSFLTRLF